MELDNFLDEAKSEGAFDSTGEFSVDWTSADRKIADFYRQHPELWFVKFIQAGVTMNCNVIHVNLTRDSVRFLMLSKAVPIAFTALGTGDEAAEYLRIGLRAVFGGADDVASVVLGRLVQGGALETLKFQQGQPQDLAISESAAESEGEDANNKFLVEIVWSKKTWWQDLRKRLRRQTNLYKLCHERLNFCPIPVFLGMLGYGQGSGDPYGAVAAEYIVGPLSQDTIVRENEPGNGSAVLDVFGEIVGGLGNHPRVFTRWCESGTPLMPKGSGDAKESLFIFPKPKKYNPYEVSRDLPKNTVPIFRKKAMAAKMVGYVELRPEFRPQGSRNGIDTPGLPIYACIVIPQQLSGPCLISFYRRGAYLCRFQADLGMPGVDVRVCCSALKTDYSGMRIVSDDAFEQLLLFLRERVLKLAQDAITHGRGIFRNTRALEKVLNSRAKS